MNKKEVSEIRKQYAKERCNAARICGCYVNGDKEKVATFAQTFLTLEDEEQFKYTELLRKCLSGSLGKNLLNMEFPLASEEEGGTQYDLLQLRDSHLKDDELLEAFYDKIIASYAVPDNYLIVLVTQAYDIPGKSTSGDEMFDASDDVYDHILCAIAPVTLSNAALSYNGEEHCFRTSDRDWIVGKPAIGFLFPAFTERQTDLHSLLYYTSKSEEIHGELIESVLGTTEVMTAGTQMDIFQNLVEEALGDEVTYEMAQQLHNELHELSEQQKELPDPVTLGQNAIRGLLEKAGAASEQLEDFDRLYEETAGRNSELLAANIMSTKKYEVSTPDVTIHVSPDRSDLVERRIIDGRACLVIPITDEVHVNGIRVNPLNTPED